MIAGIWPLVAATAALGIDAYVLAGVLPEIAESLSTTASVVGLGVTAFTAAYALAGPLLSERLSGGGVSRALLVALGVFNLGNLVTAVAPGPVVFLLARAATGAGAGIVTAVATAGAMVARDQRGRAMAAVTFGLSLGTVAGVPAGMLIGQNFGWRWTMGLVVAVGVLAMAALLARRRSLPRDAGATAGPAFRVLRTARVRAGTVAAFMLGVSSLGLYTYLLPMADSAGLGGLGFTLVWAWGIGGVAGSALVGRLLDRSGPRLLLVLLPALLAAGFLVMWLVASPVVWVGAAVVWGAAGWAGVPTLQQALTVDRPESAMQVVAFQMAAMYLGSAAGSALGSVLLSSGTGAGDLAAWAVLPALLAVVFAGAVAVDLRRGRGRDTRDRDTRGRDTRGRDTAPAR
ncbi:MFS transporter [Corynebacterium neomassiliense]|uniref:MFS transporter n=1 Tax=Corynebacterium neomassiliense TaxID=2079482 RepID=UPI00102FB273|nr:MFS transporter [Corynebacterium neomassiliense]